MASILLISKYVAAFVIFVMSMVFSSYPLLSKKFRSSQLLLGLANSFSGGLFLAAGLFHILPESYEKLLKYSGSSKTYPWNFFAALMAYLFVHFVDKVIFNGHVESEDEGDNDNNYMKDVRKKFNNSLKIDMNCVTHYGKPHEEQNLLNEPLSEHCSTDQKCKNQICPDNEIHEETFKALVRNKIMVLTNSTFKKKKQNATRPAEKIALENGDGDYQGDYIKMGSEPNS